MAARPSSLDCPKCGAPLRWRGQARVVQCRYCGASVLTPTGELTEEPAEARSRVRPRNVALIAVMVVGVNFVGAFVALVATLTAGGGGALPGQQRTTVARLVTTPFQGSSAQLAEVLVVTPSDDDGSLTVPLKDAGFDYGWLRWDDAHLDQPNGACFYANEGHPRAQDARVRLTRLFGRRLVWAADGSAAWRWGGAYVNVGENVSNICFTVDVDEPSWDTRARLLWSVFQAVVAEQDLSLQPATRKGWLAEGYSLTELAALDLRNDVDAARGYVPSLFPGAGQEVIIGLDFDVPLSHSWFGSATLHWPNERGGTLESVRLSPAPGAEALTQQAALGRCLDAALGRGETQEQDHLAGTWSERWETRDGSSIRLDPHAVSLDLDGWPPRAGTSPRRAGTYRKVLQALEGCGG